MTRVAADSGTLITQISGSCGSIPSPRWGALSMQHYSKDQPWNSDGTKLMIDNPTQPRTGLYTGGCPTKIILDGNTYAVLQSGVCAKWKPTDSRWQPSTLYPNYRIGVTTYFNSSCDFTANAGIPSDSLWWFDIVSCAQVSGRRWLLPIRPELIGQGEGNASFDGRWIAISTDHSTCIPPRPDSIVVVDMWDTTQSAVGPAFEVPPCSLSTCTIGNISISASGQYVDVKYADNLDSHRIFKVDQATRTLSIQNMATGSYRCSAYNPHGWILPLKHADMTIDPADGQDVIVGVNQCSATKPSGRVAKVRLSDGAVTYISRGTVGSTTETFAEHVSTRCQDRPGWAYVSYDTVADGVTTIRYGSEVVAWNLDGNKYVQRFGHAHAYEKDDYYHEIHPVPSRDGRRILFASNWTSKVSGTVPSLREAKAYVLDARKLPPDPVQDLASDSSSFNAIYLRWTSPPDRAIADTVLSYDLRYSTAPITEASFGGAASTGTGAPHSPGTTEHATASGLTSNTCYYFAIKSKGACDSASTLSNVYCACTLNPGGPSQDCGARPGGHAQAFGKELRLYPAEPSPGRGTLAVRYSLPDGSPARLVVYDVSGRRLESGELRLDGPGDGVAAVSHQLTPGVYFVKLIHRRGVVQTTVVVLR